MSCFFIYNQHQDYDNQLKNHKRMYGVQFSSCYQLSSLLKYYPIIEDMHIIQNLLLLIDRFLLH